MNELEIISRTRFDNVPLDIYSGNDTPYITREQAGQALEYANPQKAIDNLHGRHKDRLDKFSVTLALRATDGKFYDTVVYSLKGVMELCRHSHQPKADAFMDFTWDIMERLYKGLPLVEPPPDFLVQCGVIAPAPDCMTDNDIVTLYLQAISTAVSSGEYYLIPYYARKHPDNGILLGTYSDDIITLISSRAGAIYARAAGDTRHINKICKDLTGVLLRSGVMMERTKGDLDKSIGGIRRCAVRIIRPKVNAIAGRSFPLLEVAI